MMLFSLEVQDLFSSDNWLFKAVAYLGRISFGVYLVHCFFIMFITNFVHLNWMVLTVGTMMLTVAFICVTQKIVPRTAQKIGFY